MVNIGDPAPEIALPNQDGDIIRLSDLRGQKVIIFAFPKAGTGGCTAQACAFRDEFPQIENINAAVLGISTDKPATLKAWKAREKLQYDLLSDPDQRALDALGAGGMSLLGLVKVPIAKRSYWVIDENGIIMDMQIGVGPVESVEKALKAVQQGAAASR